MATSTPSCGTNRVLFILLLLSGQSRNALAAAHNITLVTQILSYVNESIAPCDDYYKYACGKWGSKHQNDSFMEITGLIDHQVDLKLVTLMEELQQRQLEPNSIESKVLKFYQTCREPIQSTRSGQHYLMLVPPNDQISWPQFTNISRHWYRKFQWMDTLAQLRRYGLNNVLIKVDVVPDLLNSSKYILSIDRPYFEQKNQRLRGKILTKYMLQMLGVRNAKALRLAENVKRLELAVRDLVEKEYENENENENDNVAYVELNLRQLEFLGAGRWRKYLEIVLGHNVRAEYKVRVDNIAYLVGLVAILDNLADRETLASYIMLRFAMHVLEETMDGDEPIECIQDVRRNMELAISLLYEQHFIGPEKLRELHVEVPELFELLRKQFLQKLDENQLQLKTNQREMLRSKMLQMTLNIGNMPTNVNRSQFVSQFYTDLQLAIDHDYARNHLKLLEFRTRRWFEQLKTPTYNLSHYFYMSDSDTGMSSSPYYMLRQNIIIVPYGILQEPMFYHKAHDVFKVSLLGFMLSHELMHGFVSGGLAYDAYGNANELVAQIMVEQQYANAISCLSQDKTNYLDEREADIAGIRLAYDAYFGTGSNFSQSEPSFTNVPLKQLFFLNLAQFFCGNAHEDSFTDHDADEMRLKQVLINFPAFADVYGCRQDQDNMHPSQKCRLW